VDDVVEALSQLGGKSSLPKIYAKVREIRPKIADQPLPHWRKSSGRKSKPTVLIRMFIRDEKITSGRQREKGPEFGP
jgi:hypothetical protein